MARREGNLRAFFSRRRSAPEVASSSDHVQLTWLQPEHERYWRGWRLYIERNLPWSEIADMSLEQVDLENLLLDRVSAARSQPRGETVDLSQQVAAAMDEGA